MLRPAELEGRAPGESGSAGSEFDDEAGEAEWESIGQCPELGLELLFGDGPVLGASGITGGH